ncbi:deoxynucleoside triphosphate triphosphohydrolase SAMHD1 isoform X2 [Carex littledalei]|uniref:Deoxynucleoside triphosphate triphosphohydrolase SAMHD1 isoform X2 n=1 Tax=Carex littledalei TaxID=544730 RepID=A0A833QWF4_9POAL|nr:deoxynucleoside triphosphate triphosphohydrolase SAMHD1 isoform X2 [Carex littledalei]
MAPTLLTYKNTVAPAAAPTPAASATSKFPSKPGGSFPPSLLLRLRLNHQSKERRGCTLRKMNRLKSSSQLDGMNVTPNLSVTITASGGILGCAEEVNCLIRSLQEAVHTRFKHSLGAYWLASESVQSLKKYQGAELDIDNFDMQTVQVADISIAINFVMSTGIDYSFHSPLQSTST